MEKEQKAIIFDMDGVIINNADHHRAAWIEFSKQKGYPMTSEEFEQIGFGHLNRIYLEHVFKRKLSDDEVFHLAEEKEAVYRKLFIQSLKAADGLIDFINMVKNSGYKTGVGTSAPKSNVDFIMDKLNIRQYFDVIVDDTAVSKGKPNPEVYLKAAEHLKIKPEKCVVIEDAYHGICAAHNAGMKVIGITTTYPAEKIADADLIVCNFNEIKTRHIDQLLNQ